MTHPLVSQLFSRWMNSLAEARIRQQVALPGRHEPVEFNRLLVVIDSDAGTACVADDLLDGSAGDLEVTIPLAEFLTHLDAWAEEQ